jgi:glycosyltransferase involved in cell wall biosynthesis
MPKFSVIMNCYNGEKYLREAIDSVYAQSFTDWEIVFWDNASTDGTAEIARSYDERLRYFRSAETVPLGAARKAAMQEVHGEWIAFLDCDDYWYPDKLTKQVRALEGGDYVLCYAGIAEVNPDGSPIRSVIPKYQSGPMLEQQLRQFEVNMVTPVLKKSVLDRYALGFDDSITASEEYNLFTRLMAKGNVCTIPEVLGAWRISPGSLTDRQISKWADERHYTLAQLKRENPGIELRHVSAFREAAARGEYYRARYLMSEGRRQDAVKIMAAIAPLDLKYRMLWVGMHFPFFWQLVHQNFLKRKILPRILRITNQA